MAKVRYTLEDGELVSVQWKTAIVHCGLRDNNVNEGKRTLARQWFFWRCGPRPGGCCCCNSCNLAAFPTRWAPHIREGNPAHCIDFADGDDAVRKLRDHGIFAIQNVPGETWHVDPDRGDLERFHAAHQGDKWDVLPKHLEKPVRRLFYHRNTARDLNHALIETQAKHPKRKRRIHSLKRRLDKQIGWRRHYRHVIELALLRADRESTKHLLRQALDFTPNT